MTPEKLRKIIEAKATPPIQVDWLWVELGMIAPETPDAKTTTEVQAQLDAWAWAFVSSGGRIEWNEFRKLNDLSRTAFIRAGARLRRESAMEIAAAIAALSAPAAAVSVNTPAPADSTTGAAVPVAAEADPEPVVEDFTPITNRAAAAEPAIVGAALDNALDLAEQQLRLG
jgi:hypothetical protein